jgi:SSS family transporter
MTCSLRTVAGSLLALAPAALGQVGLRGEALPDLPDPHGFAGSFAGVSGDCLVVAGGANFPLAPPWEGGAKVWHDRVFVLPAPDGRWREVGRLPRPLAYGVSVSTPAGLLCIGGSDAERHYPDSFLLRWDGTSLRSEPMPILPEPLANMGGVALGRRVHLVGGTGMPEATEASARAFELDLDRLGAGWREIAPLPGSGRILPLVAAQAGSVFVVSGAALRADALGRPQRTWLADAWRLRPDRGWAAAAGPPWPLVAAPSPATSIGASHFLAIGGDDGVLAGFEPIARHPGFPRRVLAYHTITDTWVELAPLPEAFVPVVTAPVVAWRGRSVIASGEARPGVRTPQVLALSFEPGRAAFGGLNWAILGLYLAGMIAVGVHFMRRAAASSTEAYFRGGQRIPAWVAGLSIFATMLSSLTFMGIPARAYQTDVGWYIGQLPILWIAPLVAFCYLPFFRRLDLRSAYEYLERRFGLASRVFGSASFMLFHVGRIAIVLYLPALALAAVAEIDVVPAILVIGLLCVVYTLIGGIEAVVWTDAVQAVVLLAGALVCLSVAAAGVEGGFGGIAAIAVRDGKLFDSLSWSSLDLADGTGSVWVLFVAFSCNSLISYTSSQDVVQRYVTTPDLGAARRSLWVTMWMSVFGSMLFFALGVAIYAFYAAHPARLDPALPATDSILPFYVMQQLPVGLSGLVIAAIFAASQSTVSSSLNSVATAFVEDFDARLLRPGRSDRSYLRAAKVVVALVGAAGIAAALWMAAARVESAFKAFNTMIGLTAGPLGGLFALGVFTRRAHGTGAILGAGAGLVAVLALRGSGAPVTGLLYGFVGLTVCVAVGWTASWMLPGRGDRSLALRG